MNKFIHSNKHFFLIFSLTFISACTDWNSVPVAVDDHFGDAVRHMIKAQTLNPNSAYGDNPVLGLDGQKSEGNIHVYRSGNTDLRQGKTPVKLELDSGN